MFLFQKLPTNKSARGNAKRVEVYNERFCVGGITVRFHGLVFVADHKQLCILSGLSPLLLVCRPLHLSTPLHLSMLTTPHCISVCYILCILCAVMALCARCTESKYTATLSNVHTSCPPLPLDNARWLLAPMGKDSMVMPPSVQLLFFEVTGLCPFCANSLTTLPTYLW